MLDITNSFIKSGVGWGKKRERRMEIEKGEKVTNKFSEKSLYNVTSLPQSHLGHRVYKLTWEELGLIFDDILNPLPFEKVSYRSHSGKAQIRTRKGNPTRLKPPSAMNSSSQTVFLGTLGFHGGILGIKQERIRLLLHSLTRTTSLWSVTSLGSVEEVLLGKSFKHCKKKVIRKLPLLILS